MLPRNCVDFSKRRSTSDHSRMPRHSEIWGAAATGCSVRVPIISACIFRSCFVKGGHSKSVATLNCCSFSAARARKVIGNDKDGLTSDLPIEDTTADFTRLAEQNPVGNSRVRNLVSA